MSRYRTYLTWVLAIILPFCVSVTFRKWYNNVELYRASVQGLKGSVSLVAHGLRYAAEGPNGQYDVYLEHAVANTTDMFIIVGGIKEDYYLSKLNSIELDLLNKSIPIGRRTEIANRLRLEFVDFEETTNSFKSLRLRAETPRRLREILSRTAEGEPR